jgi:hypothetical protein
MMYTGNYYFIVLSLCLISFSTIKAPLTAECVAVIEPSLKSGVHRLKINQGILDEARMHKHTYKAYRIIIKVEIQLLQLCLEMTR